MAARLDRPFDHAQTDDRQRAGGAGNNDVVLRQMLAKFVEADRLAAVLLGQCAAALDGAVGDGYCLGLVSAKMGRA